MPACQVWIGRRHLPWVPMGLQQAPTEDTGVSVSELGFGAPLSSSEPDIGNRQATAG